MQSLPQSSAPAHDYRVIPCDGYVHKLRLESREEAAVEGWAQSNATPPVSLGALLGKLALCVVALAGIAAAGGRVLSP